MKEDIDWDPKINDYCTQCKTRPSRKDIPIYRIISIDRNLGLVQVTRLAHSDFYLAYCKAEQHSVLRHIDHGELYKVIDNVISEKFPGLDWRYEEQENYTLRITDLKPIDTTYLNLIKTNRR